MLVGKDYKPSNPQPKLWEFKLFSFLWLLHCKERIEIDNSILNREYIDRLILLKGKEHLGEL